MISDDLQKLIQKIRVGSIGGNDRPAEGNDGYHGRIIRNSIQVGKPTAIALHYLTSDNFQYWGWHTLFLWATMKDLGVARSRRNEYILSGKNMYEDIRPILDGWEYDPEQNIRLISARDGRSVLQVRLPLGVEQYELDGRPDGIRPQGFDTLLESVEARLKTHSSPSDVSGGAGGFTVDHDEFLRLQAEGILFYYRYLLLFQINDFDRVVRDTEHNLRLCRLLEMHAEKDEDKVSVLQFQPYILRMHAMARSMLLVQKERYHEASSVLENAVSRIEELEALPSPVFQFERSRSISYLQTALQQIKEKDNNPLHLLEEELSRALDEENYERAAELRDRIRLIDKGTFA